MLTHVAATHKNTMHRMPHVVVVVAAGASADIVRHTHGLDASGIISGPMACASHSLTKRVVSWVDPLPLL